MKTNFLKQLHAILGNEPYMNAGGFLISVSGGVDSMVLLDGVRRLARHQSLRVAHIHHQTGPFADQSLALVEAYCGQHELPLMVGHYQHQDGNFEFEASKFRRDYLNSQKQAQEWILLGHHEMDQAETVLMALARGARIDGSIGMKALSRGRARPLLSIAKATILEHARMAKVPHCLDPANNGNGQHRTWIRHHVLPALAAIHKQPETRISEWVSEWHWLQSQLQDEADGYLVNGFADDLLYRTVIAQARPYLWPFILKSFWRSYPAFKPHFRQVNQLMSWLKSEQCGRYRCQKGWLYCDVDGLKGVFDGDDSDVPVVLHEWTEWLGCRFLIDPDHETLKPVSSILQTQGGILRRAQTCPRRWRDRMRKLQVPHRVRDRLPELSVGKHIWHLLDLLDPGRNTSCSIQWTCDDERAFWIEKLIRDPSLA